MLNMWIFKYKTEKKKSQDFLYLKYKLVNFSTYGRSQKTKNGTEATLPDFIKLLHN